MPIKVLKPKRVDVAEYIARANYHFNEGSLILKFEDGRLVHKYSLPYKPNKDIQHIKYQLNISLRVGIDEVEKHFPGILAVIYKDVPPDEAFAKVEYWCNPELNKQKINFT